jgi:hypothetical protein
LGRLIWDENEVIACLAVDLLKTLNLPRAQIKKVLEARLIGSDGALRDRIAGALSELTSESDFVVK